MMFRIQVLFQWLLYLLLEFLTCQDHTRVDFTSNAFGGTGAIRHAVNDKGNLCNDLLCGASDKLCPLR